MKFEYSPHYACDNTLYRHIVCRKNSYDVTPTSIRNKVLLDENTWRGLGIRQSLGWEHIGYSHCDERYPVLLFRKEATEDCKEEFTDPLLPSHSV